MKNRRILAAILAIVLLFSLCGCSIGGRRIYVSGGAGFQTVFRIGSMKCPEKEFRLYLENYRNLYGRLGDVNLWDGEFDTTEMSDSLKKTVLAYLARVYAMNVYAQEHDITLDTTELAKIDTAAGTYYDSLSTEERSYAKVSRKDIRKFYERYALAEKVYFTLMKSVDEEVSENEAWVMDGYVLQTTSRQSAEAAESALSAGTDMAAVVSQYSEGASGVIAFSRKTFPEKVEDAVFSLNDGERTDLIYADGTYYLVSCVTKYDQDKSEENKQNVINERKKKLIEQLIAAQNKRYYSCVNKRLLSSISVSTDSDVKTDTFFSVLDENLSYQ